MLEIESKTWLNVKKMNEHIQDIESTINGKVDKASKEIGIKFDKVEKKTSNVIEDLERKSNDIFQGYRDISRESELLAQTIESHIADAAALQEDRFMNILTRLDAAEVKLADINSGHEWLPANSDVHMKSHRHAQLGQQTRGIQRRARSLSTDRARALIPEGDFQCGVSRLVEESQDVAFQRAYIWTNPPQGRPLSEVIRLSANISK